MYLAYYGLKQKPFSLLPDPGFLYLGRHHRKALKRLEYGLLHQAGFSVVTGEVGTGKTTLIRYLLGSLGEGTRVGLITHTCGTFGDLLQWVLLSFGLDYRGKGKVEMYRNLLDFLGAEQGRAKLLVVDEAQNMAAEALEELRMLSNVNADKYQVLQVVLVGQPSLRETLRRPDLEQFAQRVTVDYHLEPLSAEETRAYIAHRLAVAGREGAGLFTDAACHLVFEYSGGIPRIINVLCDSALVYGFAEQQPVIRPELLAQVVADKRQGGIFPLRGRAGGSTNANPGTGPSTGAASTRSHHDPQFEGLQYAGPGQQPIEPSTPGGTVASGATSVITLGPSSEESRRAAGRAVSRAQGTPWRHTAQMAPAREPRMDLGSISELDLDLNSAVRRKPVIGQSSEISRDESAHKSSSKWSEGLGRKK